MHETAGTRRRAWTSVLCSLLAWSLLMPPCIEAQETTSLDPSTMRVMQEAAKQGFPLQTSLNVSGLTGISEAMTATASSQKPAPTPKGKKGATPPPPAPGAAQNGTKGAPTPPPAAGAAQKSTSTPQAATGADKKNPSASETGTVAQNVSVESVLLPYEICRRVFGKQVAQNYAAIELTISNRSPTAALIVHSIFIDYSQWAFSGNMYLSDSNVVASTQQSGSKGSTQPPGPKTKSRYPPYQAANNPSQVASAEYRVVRGGLLDAQP